MIDSHAHLYYEGIYEHLEEKIRLAKLTGVDYIMTVGTDSNTIPLNIEISEKYKNVCCSVGIHPHHYKDGYDLGTIARQLKHPRVVAVGEVGLDYHYENETPKEDQLKLFRDMLSLGEECNLPYIIHSRDCFEDIFGVMAEYSIPSAVFHCYTDNIDNAKKILDLGYYISFSGIITFKNALDLREIVRYVPSDRILIETDCPYLTPVPYRGKVNEPAYVSLVAECVAGIRETSIEDISEITSRNFFRLFKKAQFLLETK